MTSSITLSMTPKYKGRGGSSRIYSILSPYGIPYYCITSKFSQIVSMSSKRWRLSLGGCHPYRAMRLSHPARCCSPLLAVPFFSSQCFRLTSPIHCLKNAGSNRSAMTWSKTCFSIAVASRWDLLSHANLPRLRREAHLIIGYLFLAVFVCL